MLLGKVGMGPVWSRGWAAKGKVDTGVEYVLMSQTTYKSHRKQLCQLCGLEQGQGRGGNLKPGQ